MLLIVSKSLLLGWDTSLSVSPEVFVDELVGVGFNDNTCDSDDDDDEDSGFEV